MGREITELADVEFKGSLADAFTIYGDRLEQLGDQFALELEMAAGDAEAALVSLGRWWALGLDVQFKARRVAKRLVRAQEMAHGMGQQGPKIVRAYERQFTEASRRSGRHRRAS
ncbi:hypothetical protein BJF79_30695 [Actinomadura sp. CNU-125]|uniref:hypothetical protein n=1 Tax=Actinomadura sp. CNU-125 TaxID=1904961 RepID=UPI0009677021|nr:hypothetical protein [Actinomadura sp. CNU-125]OLT36742.1 hypothetical protein BJF79_30695 [Actinomadura sp. CNU-125]